MTMSHEDTCLCTDRWSTEYPEAQHLIQILNLIQIPNQNLIVYQDQYCGGGSRPALAWWARGHRCFKIVFICFTPNVQPCLVTTGLQTTSRRP